MNHDILYQWAIAYGVPMLAILDLRARLGEQRPTELEPLPAAAGDRAEALVQADLRMMGQPAGFSLFRNNVGALKDERGVPVRYGLANDTAKLNKVIKSADLIGWKTEVIGPQHLGQPFARFVSIECKRPGWAFTGTEREVAQRRWRDLVLAAGGVATFSTGDLPS